ncbi:15683_t:CDS:2, partial [Dentiscutata heterogama]
MLCFTSEEGHLYERKGWGSVPLFDCTDRHYDDSAKSLQFIMKWINEISKSADRDIQCLLLHEIFKGAMVFFEKLKCIKKLKNDEVSNEEFDSNTTKKSKDPKDMNSYQDKSTKEKIEVRANKEKLVMPNSLEEYQN